METQKSLEWYRNCDSERLAKHHRSGVSGRGSEGPSTLQTAAVTAVKTHLLSVFPIHVP